MAVTSQNSKIGDLKKIEYGAISVTTSSSTTTGTLFNGNVYEASKTITFDTAFSSIPIVTVSMYSLGHPAYRYYSVDNITNSSFRLTVVSVSPNETLQFKWCAQQFGE